MIMSPHLGVKQNAYTHSHYHITNSAQARTTTNHAMTHSTDDDHICLVQSI